MDAPRVANCEGAPQESTITEICFDYKIQLLFATLALYLLLATFFNINGSSAGSWDQYLGQRSDNHILIGTPKSYRADEWAFHTPAILSQCNSKPPFPTENYSLGGYKAPLVMNVPVRHFSMVLRPQFWPFFIVNPERAFAFYWNAKLVILIGGVFLLLMVVLENNFFLSLFGALWVFFSGYMQWWYSSPQEWPELVGCFALFTTAFIQMLISRRKIVVALSSFVFLIAFFNFAVSLYPAHQVPLAYLSCCIIIGVLLPRFRMVYPELLTNRFRLISVTLALTAGLIFLFYSDIKQTLDAFASTVYPGRRRSTGGGVSIVRIFSGFFGTFLSERHFPKVWDNACESSNFFLFFPVPLMFFGLELLRRKKVSALNIGLVIYIAIILFWLIWGFPKPVAQLTLFDRVLERRALLPLGIASIMWTCLLLHRTAKEHTLCSLKCKTGITAIMFIGTLIYSYYFNIVTDDFASISQIIMVCAFVTGASFLLLFRIPLLFAGLILIPNIFFHGLVNPICTGLSPILSNPIYEKISDAVRQDPEAKWIVYGKGVPLLANLTYAAGAKVFNGLKYIPHLDEMRELSLDHDDMTIYNRYGYISLSPGNGPQISFKLLNGRDLYEISVDPENDCWRRLHIAFLLLPTKEGILVRHRGTP